MLSATTSQPASRPASAEREPTTRDIHMLGQRFRVAIRPGDGTRTPLLLMNGIGVGLELLQPLVDALDPAIEVIRFDAPGVGGSPAPLLPYHFPALAYLVTRLLDQLGYGRVDTLGVSWGGALAQQFALQHPWRCRRLALVSTATGALMVPGDLAALAGLAAPWSGSDLGALEVIAPEIASGALDLAAARDLAAQLRLGDPRGYLYQLLGGAGWTSLPWLPYLRQRTLIMAGDDDRLIPQANARLMHLLAPRSRLHVFHGGHLGFILQATELAPAIGAFLASD